MSICNDNSLPYCICQKELKNNDKEINDIAIIIFIFVPIFLKYYPLLNKFISFLIVMSIYMITHFMPDLITIEKNLLWFITNDMLITKLELSLLVFTISFVIHTALLYISKLEFINLFKISIMLSLMFLFYHSINKEKVYGEIVTITDNNNILDISIKHNNKLIRDKLLCKTNFEKTMNNFKGYVYTDGTNIYLSNDINNFLISSLIYILCIYILYENIWKLQEYYLSLIHLSHKNNIFRKKNIFRQNECIICLEKVVEMIGFKKCGHVCYCISCYGKLPINLKKCPYCKKKSDLFIDKL